MSDIKKIVSFAAITYATANITPVLDKLSTLDASVTTQNKLLAYHVFETCLLAQGEKVTHAMLEATVNKPFDKRVSAKGRKVADYVMNEKSFIVDNDGKEESLKVTAQQFRPIYETKLNDDKTKSFVLDENGNKIVKAPAKFHVMTVYGWIAAHEKERNAAKKATKSSVEQALQDAAMPIEMADKYIALANDGNDAAATFVESAIAKFPAIEAEKVSQTETAMTPEQTLESALNVLMDMPEESAALWLTNAVELLGFTAETETVTETPQSVAA